MKSDKKENSGYLFYRTNAILSLIIIVIFVIQAILWYSIKFIGLFKYWGNMHGGEPLAIAGILIFIAIYFLSIYSPYLGYKASSNFYKNNLNKSIISNVLVIISCLIWVLYLFFIFMLLFALVRDYNKYYDTVTFFIYTFQWYVSPFLLLINFPLLKISKKKM